MEIIRKNITEVTKGIICHGVNCQGVMGSGVAKAIKEKWPIVYDSFKSMGKGAELLGQCHILTIDEELYIANCYSQEYYGRDGKRYACLSAVESSLRPVFLWASTLGLVIHSPMIGCGLGGLKWDDVSKIFEKLEKEYTYDAVVIHTL